MQYACQAVAWNIEILKDSILGFGRALNLGSGAEVSAVLYRQPKVSRKENTVHIEWPAERRSL